MKFHWNAPRPATFRDPYLDWSRLLGKRLDAIAPVRPDRGTEYEPIFVRLVDNTPAARKALQDALKTSTSLLMDPHEADALAGRIDDPRHLAGLPDEYALYRRIGTPDHDHGSLFTVIDTGVPIHLQEPPKAPPAAPLTAVHPHHNCKPIVAIIDDGIGFLNDRFCKGNESRFHAIWLQALESRSDEGGILSGRVLDRATITSLRSEPEADVYARLNRELQGFETRAASNRATTHGTHVLDLAAGAEDGDPVADWPLLAVQLPPEAVDDTSGTWFESYILQGLRWILRQAASIDPTSPVIVNLSLGVSAGPKDGTRFAEHQLAREARLWEEHTGQPVRLVWSFGNGNRNDLTATWDLDAGGSADILARVQPDDMTASYVEVFLRGAGSEALGLTITAPDGTSSGALTLDVDTVCSLKDAQDRAVARLYHAPARHHGDGTEEPAHYVLALAPSAPRKPGEATAPCGAWKIEATTTQPARLLMMIQRDDALAGSRLRGRQAHFDAPNAYGWDADTAEYTCPQPGGPVTRAGSHNAMCTTDCRQLITVGAALHSGRMEGKHPENFTPARYSASGCDWSTNGPTVSAVVEYGPFSGGIRASGTLSGSRSRIGGTSAAAGVITRALALSAARIVENARDATTVQLDDFDPAVLDLFNVLPEHAAQLGTYVVVPLPASDAPHTVPETAVA